MKAPPADVRLLSTPTSILILGPSSAFGMPDLKPVSVLGTFELGPNDRHAFGVLQSIQSDNYEMTKAQDYLGKMAGETYTISNTALNRDTIFGLHSHLQSGKSQMIVVDRYYRHATAFTAYAKSGTGHVPLAHPNQPAAKAAASPKLPVLQAAPATQAIPPPANVGSWSVEQRLKLLFEDMLPLLGQDLRAYVQSMLTGEALASLVAGVVVMAGLQAIPGVGWAADVTLLGVTWLYAGWDGLRAVPVLVKAVRHAASATTTGEIEAAAPDAARALETLGGDVLAILIVCAAKRNSSGGKVAGAVGNQPAPQVVNANRGKGVGTRNSVNPEPEKLQGPAAHDTHTSLVSADFVPLGISKSEADSYLTTPDGQEMLDQLQAADSQADYDTLRSRALGQLRSGIEQPVMMPITGSLVKIVPSGQAVDQYSPYFTSRAEIDAASADPHGLAEQLGLPNRSQASQYDMYQILPQGPQNAFVSRVAPTIEGGKSQPGGAIQYLVPNRNNWSEPRLIGHVTDSGQFTPHQ